ncbi:MAG: O-antigen ligase family protein, partial [Myxococcaceae bacterium]
MKGSAVGWRGLGVVVPLALWGVGALSVEALASLGLALCCVWVLLKGLWREQPLRAWSPLLAFVLWSLIASTVAGRPPSGTGIARLADWLAIPLAACAWPTLEAGSRRRLAYVFAGVFLLSCLLAGLQHFGIWPAHEFFQPLAWTQFPFHRLYEPVPGVEGRFMGGGLLAHRLKFAHTGGLAVLVALVIGLKTTGRDRVLALGVAVLGALSVMIFPFARGATVALLGAALLAVFLCVRGRARWVGVFVVLVGFSVVAFRPALRDRFLSSFSAQGSGDRSFLLEAGLTAARAHPWVGTGAGRFKVRDYGAPETPQYVLENTGKAHNQLLSIAAEVGVPGLLLFLALLLALALRRPRGSLEQAVGLVALLHFLLLSLAHDPLYQAPFSMALCLVLSFAAQKRGPGVRSPV